MYGRKRCLGRGWGGKGEGRGGERGKKGGGEPRSGWRKFWFFASRNTALFFCRLALKCQGGRDEGGLDLKSYTRSIHILTLEPSQAHRSKNRFDRTRSEEIQTHRHTVMQTCSHSDTRHTVHREIILNIHMLNIHKNRAHTEIIRNIHI